MQSISLDITGMPAEFTGLQAGGLYWVACAGADHADLLAAGVLARSGTAGLAVLAGLGRSPAPSLELLPAEEGPARVRLYQCPAGKVRRALPRLADEMAGAAGRIGALCIVQCPATALEAFDDARLAQWCGRLQQWARTGRYTVLLLCHGEVAALAPRLLPLHRSCSGVAQLHPHRGALQYLVHFWANQSGVVAHREFQVERAGRSLGLIAAADEPAPVVREGGDRFLHLAQARALEGAPPFSPAWRLYESWSTLVVPALQAQAASVVFAIEENAQVDALAHLLYRLRSERGNGLKLVVREMAPCLRYADERLLLQCGASLIVPANIPLPRFLTLLETIQGQRWYGQLPEDPERLVRAHRPPDVEGVVDALRFRQIVGDLFAQEDGMVESAVLALQPVAGLRPEQVLQQLRIRRRGDLACIHGRQVWLFLFACRSDGVERALENLFRLPWREMFDGYQRLAEYDVATMNAIDADPETARPLPAAEPEFPPAARPFLQPRPLRLGGRE
ncbi:cellulose biosynthesis protein BcsE [[Pseudomonas] boreopolis]|uniref:cellulose biosynthesis protein BcsE n=1 Tax=Xanthomonas boreopolis TaxID=86183 RepID=UPI003D9BEAF6